MTTRREQADNVNGCDECWINKHGIRKYCDRHLPRFGQAELDAAVQAAVEAEREACAKEVESHLVGPLAAGLYEPHRYCCDMANAIRARAATKPTNEGGE